MLASVESATIFGVEGQRVTVEVHVGNGLPAFQVVGLPDASCRESRDRVRAAIISSGLRWPSARITVNLAPSGVPKHGSGLDLAIAIGIVAADGQIAESVDLSSMALMAELGLDGSLRPVRGTLGMVGAVRADTVVVAEAMCQQAELCESTHVRTAKNLAELIAALHGTEPWPNLPLPNSLKHSAKLPDLAEVKGQAIAKRALEVAAAGGHNLLFIGPAGAGKSMLARRLPSLLPKLDHQNALIVTTIHSVAGLALPNGSLIHAPPFRAPHHSATMASLIGGGSSHLRPGEISCAHGGVLFLDELGEFNPTVLDALRQPLEEGQITINRANISASLPSEFMLVAAMNPCPCGNLGFKAGACMCTNAQKQRYRRRLSGPLLDRIDLRVHTEKVDAQDLLPKSVLADGLHSAAESREESSAVVRERVKQARKIANSRGVLANAALKDQNLEQAAPLSNGAVKLLHSAVEHGHLSARGLARVRRVGRTIADLKGLEVIAEAEIAEALALRQEPVLLQSPQLVGHHG